MAILQKRSGSDRWGLSIRPNEWYAVSFVGVMATGAALVFLLERFGLTTGFLWIALLVGTLFHTWLSIEGLLTSTDASPLRNSAKQPASKLNCWLAQLAA